MKRVLKWPVPVDDKPHPIGAGPVVLVGIQNDYTVTVYVWTEEGDVVLTSSAQVYGTGHPVPDEARHLGSTLAGHLVWHVYRQPR